MKLSKSNKDKLIGGIITIVFLVATLLVKEWFEKRKSEGSLQQTNIENPINLTSNDSSKQIAFQQEQVNANKGNVTNEFVFGDKNINQPESKQLEVSKMQETLLKHKSEEPITQIEKIENNGNLSIGQSGGIVNQTTVVNPKAQFSEEEKKEIIKNINLKYREVGQRGATCVQIIPNQSHPKSFELSDDLEAFLKEQGYQIIPNTNFFNIGGMEEKVQYRVSKGYCMSLVITYL